MATFLSPDVVIQERDDSTSNRAYGISTGVAVLASNFGPVLDPQLVNSEDDLVNIFGQPNDNNYKNWMSIANFLAYSDSCYAIRMETENQFNANAAGKTGWEVEQFENSKGMMVDVVDEDGDPVKHRVGLVINNDVDYAANYESGNGNFGEFAARYPGSIGNSIMVTYADADTFKDWVWTDANGDVHDWRLEYAAAPGTSRWARIRDGHNDEIHLLVIDAGGQITGTKGTILEKYEYLNKSANARSLDGVASNYKRVLKDQSNYVYCMDYPGKDLLTPAYNQTILQTVTSEEQETQLLEDGVKVGDQIINTKEKVIKKAIRETVISDEGVRKTVIKFVEVAQLLDWVKLDYKVYDQALQVTYQLSVEEGNGEPKLTPIDTDEGAWGVDCEDVTFKSLKAPYFKQMSGGTNDFEYTDADEMKAWDLVANKEKYDVGLCICGPADATVSKYVIQNICEARMDCVAFCSPSTGDRGPILGTLSSNDRAEGITSSEMKVLQRTLAYRNEASFGVNSSYGHLDSGWKYQYDKYNDCNRWVPLNGDCAGLYAQCDTTTNQWTSAAGFNRGQIKNVIKLSYSPEKAHRDQLYPAQINPVVTFVGEGTVLYGSKSLLNKPSAFDRLNVRRLFIYLEKNVAEVARYLMFELNNPSTREYAINLVEPILRTVSGLGGVENYKVICNEQNNGPDVINANKMVIDIFVVPNRTCDWIQLNFTCSKSGQTTFSISGE
jgi:phage tail sheath protein